MEGVPIFCGWTKIESVSIYHLQRQYLLWLRSFCLRYSVSIVYWNLISFFYKIGINQFNIEKLKKKWYTIIKSHWFFYKQNNHDMMTKRILDRFHNFHMMTKNRCTPILLLGGFGVLVGFSNCSGGGRSAIGNTIIPSIKNIYILKKN